MDSMLQSRIQNLIGSDLVAEPFAEGGEVDAPEEMMVTEMEALPDASAIGSGPGMAMQQQSNEDLDNLISSLMAESLMQESRVTEDMSERSMFEDAADNLIVGQNAPLLEQAQMLASHGRGGDTQLAHLRVGEVVLPPESMEDPQFESAVERKFEELDLDPRKYIVGAGIASLNPTTGLEEFGWFKKTFKSIAKVSKKAAPYVAGIAALGAVTGSKSGGSGGFKLTDLFSGGGADQSGRFGYLGDLVTGGGFDKTGRGGILGDIFTGGGVDKTGRGGLLGDVFQGTGRDRVGRFGLIGDFAGSIGDALGLTDYASQAAQAAAVQKAADVQATLDAYTQADPNLTSVREAKILSMQANGFTPEQIVQSLVASGDIAPSQVVGTANTMAQTSTPLQPGSTPTSGAPTSGGGGLNLGTVGSLGIAGLLAKLAYDEAKDRKGVPLTPLTQEGATGRYNIEAEIARRMGRPAPNPVEFGLLPAGTMPPLSGGRPNPNSGTGTTPMAYAKGGNVAVEDFERMNGGINGEGTETSDDVPAMLSDGEFVMTGQAVRGAGAFDLDKGDGGIITLTPSGSESREDGTKLMYEMMDLFAEFADKPKSKRATA